MSLQPGTPVGQLFRGMGDRPPLQPPLPSQVMSPTQRGRSLNPQPGNLRGSTPAMGSSTQTPVHQTWFMLGELIRLRQGDEEASRERYYYEHQESMAARQRSELLQQEFEAASQTLRAELTLQAEQYMNHYAQEEQAYFHSTARAMEMHAEALMAQERAQLMHHYLVQTTEVEQRARAAETVFNQLHQEHLEQFQEVNAQHEETQQLLRRELEESQQEGEANAEESQRIRQILQRERAMQEQNLVRQAEGWRQHSASVAEVAQRTIAEREDDLTIERLNADELRTELQEAQADLTQWQEWYDQYDWPEEEEGDLYDAEGTAEEEAAAAAPVQEQPAAAGVVPNTPVGPPATPPVLLGQIPAHLMPPSTLPTFGTAQPVPSARPTSNVTRAVQQQPLTQTPPGISLPIGASLPNPSTPAQTSQPNYGNATLNPPLGVATAVPAAPSGPWSFTRQAYKGVNAPMTGVDVNTIPISAGVSVASAGSQLQPQLSQQQWAAGSVAGTSGVLPQGQACPVQAVGGPTLQPQVPLTTSTPEEPISRNKSSLPKLQVKGGDATTITRTINEWVQKTAIALNTWSLQASTFWNQAVTAARAQHNWWLSLQPSDRASYIGLPTTNQTLPTQTPVVEATVRAELLNSVLPDKVTSMAMQKGALTVLDLLFLTFQTFLPSEPSARVDGLNAVETPLRAAKNFNEALTTLRTWRQQILTVVTDLQGNPEPLKLFNSLKVLISNLVSSDNSFATEVSQMYRNTGIKNSCTDQALLQLMNLLEIEMSARAMEDDEERRRKGQANAAAAAAATTSTQATAAAVGKGKGKGGGKSKDSKGKGKKTQTTVCQDYMTDRGCPRGDQCTFAHPRKPGKCLRCGGINHDLSTCRRPPRDPKLNAPNSNVKPKGSGGKGNPPPKAKSQPKNTSRGGANAVWACEEIIEDAAGNQVASASASMAALNPINSLHVTDDPDYLDINATACTFYTTFLPTFHSAANSDEPMENHPENQPILDTGATHCLMPLSWLGEAECELAKRIHLKVATGSTVRALLYNNVIYAKSVNRPLVSVGQLKGMIDLRFIWDDASPLLITCHAGKKYVVLKANIVHHLPLISRSDLQVLLNAIHDFTTKGEIWDIQRWSAELNRKLDEFYWNNPSSTPTGYHINSAEDAQAMFSALDLPQEGLLNPADNADEKFSTRYAEPTAEVAQKDLVTTAVAETVLNPIASATTKGSEEQVLTKSAPKKIFRSSNLREKRTLRRPNFDNYRDGSRSTQRTTLNT